MNFKILDVPINIKQTMQEKNIWSSQCPVPLNRLKLLELTHYDFNFELKNGQMIVLDSIAEAVILIFKDLLKLKFPICTIKLIDEFGGDDELSMQENNSSCFNFRKIDGSDLLSMHSYGLAIDINPVQNPVIQNGKILPLAGKEYLERGIIRKGMVEPIVDIFNKHGFTIWGGNWTTPLDYHHFQFSRDQLEFLIG